MYSFDYWFQMNKVILKYLYNKLFLICKTYGITLINNKNTKFNFLLMMYNESNKDIIDKNLNLEYFYRKYNSKGYEDYTIS